MLFGRVQVKDNPRGSTVKIVLATADTNQQLSLGLYLSEEPLVTIVGSTSEAESLLALIKFTRPDIVIADWDLPGRPVTELLSETRKMGDRPKWIVFSPSTITRKEVLEAGATAVVVRGDPPEVLLNAFRNTRVQLGTLPDEKSMSIKED